MLASNRLIRLTACLLCLVVASPAVCQRIVEPTGSARSASTDATSLDGTWTYRSFHSRTELSDPSQPLSQLLFGQAEMTLAAAPDGRLSGVIGGPGWQLALDGKILEGSPRQLLFQGKGIIGGEQWVYDYLGYVVPAWPEAIDQRPSIVGSVIRSQSHSAGAAPKGYVAQWIAVQQASNQRTVSGGAPGASQPAAAQHSERGSSYRQQLLQDYLKQDATDKGALSLPANADRVAETPAPLGSPSATRAARPVPAADSEWELNVEYATQTIGRDSVRLRSYNGQLVGPVIRAKAGSTLHLILRNKLPVEPGGSHPVNSHHDWNTTNLHFHGLHVAPQGSAAAESDNVLLELKPTSDPAGAIQKYELHIPADHVAGTFWYHAHKHGSVAAQVASGMAGALIIERDDNVHNLDSVPEIAAASANEQVMVLQQIPYLKPAGAVTGSIERSADGSGSNEVAMFGPTAWSNLRRYVTVNGQRIPTLNMAPGEVRRWRLIHSGQRQELALRIVRAPGTSGTGDNNLNFHEIAADGLPLGDLRTRDQLRLFPGYRSDVLIQPSASTSGEFHLIDANAPTGTAADGSPEPLRLVARLMISGPTQAMSLPDPASLAVHRLPLIDPSAVTGEQHAYYGIVPVAGSGVRFYVANVATPAGTVPSGREFDPTVSRNLVLGATERWIVGSRNAGLNVTHPFHIHVNPFYIEEVRNAAGVDVTAAEIGGPLWRDTLALKQGFTYRLLTRYADFSGDFVNHCHILDHEDNGMMELVKIVNPSSPPSPPQPDNVLTELPRPAPGRPQVLLFVKGSFCPHCMTQLNDIIPQLVVRPCDPIVVSASSASDLSNFPNLAYKLLADPSLTLFRRFQLIANDQTLHATLVISPDGREVFRHVDEQPLLDPAPILKALDAFGRDALPGLTIAIRGTDSTTDDYVTWAPCLCSMRVEPIRPGQPDVQITLTNDDPSAIPEGGDLRFATSLSPGQTATAATITLSVKQDGTPTNFYIAGAKASSLTSVSLTQGGRDAVIAARLGDASGPIAATHAVMVRVRKNASILNDLERFELLKAFAALKGSGQYERLVALHTLSTGRSPGATWRDQAHRGRGFLPWHRAFLLHFERELQSVSPHVALAYWREDQVSSVFVPQFMGGNTVAPLPLQDVDLGSLTDPRPNPLLGWTIAGTTLRRVPNDRSDISWCEPQLTVLSPLDYGNNTGSFAPGVERNPHNVGHGWVGGWMSSCQTSPRDPIFFLFHCDVDRLWAQWQWQHGRFSIDGSDVTVYSPNDAYAPGSTQPLGHHLFDTMWPWNMVNGPASPTDPNDDRPGTNPESPFPLSPLPGISPAVADGPAVRTMIDYLGSAGGQDLGFCYDDAPFGSQSQVPSSTAVPSNQLADTASDRSRPLVVRMRAARQLSSVESVQQRQTLLETFSNPQEADPLRLEIFQAAGGAEDPLWIESALKVIQARDQSSSTLRSHLIGQVGIVSMFSGEGHHRREAIEAQLMNLVNESEPADVRHAALAALVVEPSVRTIELLRSVIVNKREQLVTREAATHLLAAAAPGQNRDVFRALLSDNESDAVRSGALRALGDDPDSLDRRKQILLDPKNSMTLRSAALKSCLHDSGFPNLAMQLLADAAIAPDVKRAAAGALNIHWQYHALTMPNDSIREIQMGLQRLAVQHPAVAELILPLAQDMASHIAKANR